MFNRMRNLAIGMSIGMIVAPKPGSETRKDLASWWKGQLDEKTVELRGQLGSAVSTAAKVATEQVNSVVTGATKAASGKIAGATAALESKANAQSTPAQPRATEDSSKPSTTPPA